jgi:hypothetical protein
MDEKDVIAALSRGAQRAPARTEACLRPDLLAALLDGGLDASRRLAAETHVADCGFCLAQLAVLIRSADDAEPPAMPDSVIARAERLAVRPARRFGSRHGWAAAAVVVLAVGLLSTQWAPPGVGPSAKPPRQTRYADGEALQPRLLAPVEGSVIEPLEQVFHWTAVPGSLFYDVRLVSPDGDLLLRERVNDTRWLIPAHLELRPGEEYFVRVDAYLNDAKYLSSEHVVFTVNQAASGAE